MSTGASVGVPGAGVNDYQLRHGTRFILSLYEKAGHSWMNYEEKHQMSNTSLQHNVLHVTY